MNEDKPIIAERIRDLRKEKGLTQEQLAEILGLNAKSSIANYESGANAPSDDIKLKMCEIFDCSMDYLMGSSEFRTKRQELDYFMSNNNSILILKTIDRYYYEFVVPCQLKEEDIDKIVSLLSDVKNKETSKKAINEFLNKFDNETTRKKVRELIDIIIKELINSLYEKSKYHYLASQLDIYNDSAIDNNYPNQFYMCPVYGQISAGQPNWADECIEGRIPLDTDLMGIVNPEEHFFLRVNGESMNKVIKNGAFALIHKQDMVNDGEIAVVLVNGYDATLKKFTRQGDMIILEPQSTDTSIKTQVYDKTTPIKILGKYVGKMEINK